MLTVTKATSQARRHVDRIMPGVMATVDSRLSHDLATDTPTVVTTITFPENHPATRNLEAALVTKLDHRKVDFGPARITITRAR